MESIATLHRERTPPQRREQKPSASPVGRYVTAVATAVGVTLGLFLLMHFLIAGAEAVLDDSARTRVIDFVRLRRAAELNVKKRVLPKRDQPQPRPATPSFDVSSSEQVAVQELPMPRVAPPGASGYAVALTGRGPRLGIAPPSDADVVPLVRVQPMYPHTAAQRGIEGWVTVEFDISVIGRVKDPKVVSSEPPRIFDREALRAIRKWKYKPKVQDGTAVERKGIRVKLEFTLDNTTQ